jgi:hypothetical protein
MLVVVVVRVETLQDQAVQVLVVLAADKQA